MSLEIFFTLEHTIDAKSGKHFKNLTVLKLLSLSTETVVKGIVGAMSLFFGVLLNHIIGCATSHAFSFYPQIPRK